MQHVLWLNDEQWNKLEPLLPVDTRRRRVDDRRIISGILYVIINSLMWKDAPLSYGPHKTLYNRCVRWSRKGVLNDIVAELAGVAGLPDRLMIDATHLKVHRTAASLRRKGADPAASGARKAA